MKKLSALILALAMLLTCAAAFAEDAVGAPADLVEAAKAEGELSDAQPAIQLLGGKVSGDFEFSLPVSDEERHVIVIDKVKETPKKYPRKPGTPNREPLDQIKR